MLAYRNNKMCMQLSKPQNLQICQTRLYAHVVDTSVNVNRSHCFYNKLPCICRISSFCGIKTEFCVDSLLELEI